MTGDFPHDYRIVRLGSGAGVPPACLRELLGNENRADGRPVPPCQWCCAASCSLAVSNAAHKPDLVISPMGRSG
jgi:hypothetical protein